MNLSAVMRPVYAGDDTGACARFDKLIDRRGFAPVQVGGLREGGKLMQLGGRSTHCTSLNKTDRLLPMDTEVECDR